MKPSEVVDVVAEIEEAWRDLTPGKKKLYAEELAGLDAASTRRAVRALVRRSRFLPTIAEIRQEERDERGVHPDVPDYGYVRYALPSGEDEVPKEWTPEQREKWEAVKTLLREKPAGRAFPKALDDLPPEAFEKPAFRLGRDAMCDGVRSGQGEQRGRHLVCGACGDDLDADCPVIPRKDRKCMAIR